MRTALSGKNHPMYGKHHSQKSRKKMRIAHIGKRPTKETIEKMRLAHMGKISPRRGKRLSKKTKEKIAISLIGNINGFKKGAPTWNKGIKIDRNKHPNMGHFKAHTEDAKKKIGKANRKNGFCVKNIKTICLMCNKVFYTSKKRIETGRGQCCSIQCKNKMISGARSHLWKGGISRLPYPFNFNKELKEIIRKRDNYKCQLCGVPQEECIKTLHVHHKDENKKNCNPNNLITLCNSCHSKVRFNKDYLENYFSKLTEVHNG